VRTKLSHKVLDGYLKITLAGETPGPEARLLLQKIKVLADESGKSKILVDGLNVSAPMPDMERYDVGELAAAVFGHRYKIAVIYRLEHINKFMENVAVNRGAYLNVVGSELEAIEWLIG